MDSETKVASLEAENQVLREKVNKLEDEVQNLLDLKRELFTLKEMLLKEVDDE